LEEALVLMAHYCAEKYVVIYKKGNLKEGSMANRRERQTQEGEFSVLTDWLRILTFCVFSAVYRWGWMT
jgi:hypothetical protein